MSRLYVHSESVAARRRFPIFLVDSVDGLTPETSEAGGQPQITKVGAAWGNTSATLTAVGNGHYYVELTAGELDTLGYFAIRYKSANTAEFNMDGQVIAFDLFTASVPQTGDSYARLGAPAGASVSADIAAIEAQTDDIGVAGAGLTALGDTRIANLDAAVSTRATPVQVNAEVLDVLNVDTFAEPAQGTPPPTTTLQTKLSWLYKFLINRISQTTTESLLYNSAETIVDSKAPVSDSGTVFTRGKFVSGP